MEFKQTGYHSEKYALAFTLAEVLITLGIIGVVAALTIPQLINKSNDMENYAAFKKKYSEISAACTSIIQDEGGRLTSSSFSSVDDLLNKLSSKLSFIKTCSGAAIKGDCWNNVGAYRYDTGVQYNTDSYWFGTGIRAAIMKDGSTLGMYITGVTCDDSSTPAAHYECARLWFDVNGLKPPNTYGKDVFSLNLHQTKVGPGNTWGGSEAPSFGGIGVGMTGWCLINKCPP